MSELRRVEVLEPILKANDVLANQLKEEWSHAGIFAVNLLSAPGAGKTTLLEATLVRIKDQYRVLVLVGDIETERDAERVRALGVDVLQITTGGTCHLEAFMVRQAWERMKSCGPFDFIFIENVGNLVCPASYGLGEHLRVVLLSVPEGDDKPKKYPKAFRTAGVFLVTKMDLVSHFKFDVERVKSEALDLNPRLVIMELSAQSGEGMETWLNYLENARKKAGLGP